MMKTGLLVIWSSMQTSEDNLPGPIAVFPLGWNIALFCFCTSVHMLTGIPLHNFSLIQCPVQTVIHHLQNDKESCNHGAVDSYYHHGRRKSLPKKSKKKLMNTRLNIRKNTLSINSLFHGENTNILKVTPPTYLYVKNVKSLATQKKETAGLPNIPNHHSTMLNRLVSLKPENQAQLSFSSSMPLQCKT